MRTARVVRVAVTLGLLVTGLVACKSGDQPGAQPQVGSSAAHAASDALDTVYRQINGTVPQRIAGEEVTYHVVQKYTAGCMAKLKVTYYPPEFSTAYEGLSDADLSYGWDNGGWLGRPSSTDLGVQRSKLSQARTSTANQVPSEVDAMSDADRARYADQLGKCEAPESLYADKDTAGGAADLQDKLNALVNGVLAKPEVQKLTSGYGACMRKAGYSGVTDPGAVQRQVAAKYPALTAAPIDGKAAGAGWKDAVAAEAKAAAADAGCRQQLYNVAMVAVGAALTSFTSTNAAALSAVQAQWDAITKAAQAAG
jgi:hypothetical protein